MVGLQGVSVWLVIGCALVFVGL